MTPAIQIAPTEVDILCRVVAPDRPGLPADVAKVILKLDFPRDDRERMQVLAEKASEGTLTADEQVEMDNYIRVGHFINLMQSKARISLRDASPGA
ncbi:MAG TPA: hypothetical protein VMV69_11895 [Pirellulales bacterium]|nr:hypothetical protein [Pirellulales bacterium]